MPICNAPTFAATTLPARTSLVRRPAAPTCPGQFLARPSLTMRNPRVRRRAAARPRTHGRRDCLVAGKAAGALPLRHRGRAASDARRRGPVGSLGANPATPAGRNRQPAPRAVRAYTRDEIDAIAAELSPAWAPLPAF